MRPERIRSLQGTFVFLKVCFGRPYFRYEGSNHLFHAFFQGFFGLLRRKGRGLALSLAARVHLLASKRVRFGLVSCEGLAGPGQDCAILGRQLASWCSELDRLARAASRVTS